MANVVLNSYYFFKFINGKKPTFQWVRMIKQPISRVLYILLCDNHLSRPAVTDRLKRST